MKKVARKMAVLMGFSMSLVLSLVGTATGGHFTIPSWLISFGISFVISLMIGFLVPVKLISDKLGAALHIKPRTLGDNLFSSLVSDIIYTPIITIIMVVTMLKMAAAHAPAGAVPPVGKVLPGSLLICFLVGYVVICVLQPIFLKICMKGMRPE